MVISVAQLSVFLLIVSRISGIFLFAPVFSSRNFYTIGKVALAIWTAAVLWFIVPIQVEQVPVTWGPLITTILTQFTIGVIIGFFCNTIFLAVQAAGEIIDLQMGLSVASALDPNFGSVISVVGRLSFFIALIAFLTFNGHHMILSGLHQSFNAIPLGAVVDFSKPQLMMQMVGLVSFLWLTAIQLSAPAILIIFLMDFSFGIISKVAPQVNVFMLGFQIKPSLGLISILVTAPILIKHINGLVEKMAEEIIKLFMYIR